MVRRQRNRKRRRLRRWAKWAMICFACFVTVRISVFPKIHFNQEISTEQYEKAQEETQKEAVGYPEYVGNRIIYYNQEDPRWGEMTYGPVDRIADAGCGPTVLSMAVSSFTENKLNPKEMCDWAYVNGYCSIGYGSFHTLIANGLKQFGIENTVTNNSREVEIALESGKPVIALMGEGHFTRGGHFILLCEMDANKKVIVADPKSVERTMQRWDFNTIAEEAKMSPAAGGAFWILDV